MYLLFNCNECKFNNSLELIGLFDEKHLREVIKDKVSQNSFKINTNLDLNTASIQEINANLKFGYIKFKEDNVMYLLFSCDELKSHNSMELIGLFNEKHLRAVIMFKVLENDFELEPDIDLSIAKIEEVNRSLKYAYIQKVELNKVL